MEPFPYLYSKRFLLFCQYFFRNILNLFQSTYIFSKYIITITQETQQDLHYIEEALDQLGYLVKD